MGKHVKQTYVKVGFNKEDAAVLREVARRESELRKDPELGVATIVRELVMPRAYDRLADLKTDAVRSADDRRSGQERRTAAATVLAQ